MISANFSNDFLHMDVLCVRRYRNYTLAGIGSNLFVYSDESLLLSELIFVGERIHSINVKNELILVKGGRQLALVKLQETSSKLECKIVSKIQSSDWIQAVVMFENHLGGLVTAHNFFEHWDLEKDKQLNVCACEEKCILYPVSIRFSLGGRSCFGDSLNSTCCRVVIDIPSNICTVYSCNTIGGSVEDLVVFAGTVFGDVLIWSPILKNNPTLQTLRGHNGAVFSVEIKPGEKLLATTSDDRSLKIWSVTSEKKLLHPGDWKNATIHLTHTLFGHTARVWRSLILPNCYLTIGEDSRLIVWSRDGNVMKSVGLHQESGIRALDCSEDDRIITTGGEDGGINAFPLKYLTGGNVELKVVNLGQSMSTKVCFTKAGLVYTLNGSCVTVRESGERDVLYNSDNFSSYCVLEVSPRGDYIAMGSIKGHLVVIDTDAKIVSVEEQVVDGRIYSIHWLDGFLLTCGPVGRLDLWEFSNRVLKNSTTMTLPNSKDRWTTCGAIQNGKLIIGDRMGNLHVYELQQGENPVKSFRKIHSYLGVTDVKTVEGGCLSIGRDGTVKEFRDDVIHSVTCRLPMEWPWKIVRHKDDTLILGFHSVSFVVWSMKNQEIIASHECGGGHRSCDYKLNKNRLSFLYVKDKKVCVVELTLDGITRIRSGFHGKEINCLKILQNGPTVMVTGSEDTTVRVSRIENSELKSVEVLKTHVSSVRAVCTCTTQTGELIVSAGGKGQIAVWDFDAKTQKCREVVNHRLRKEDHNWKSSTPAVDPETRIMCADIVKMENEFLIAAGCSDCQVRIFTYGEAFGLLCSIPFTHCVLNVAILEVDSTRVLVSMGTDGRVAFWDVTDCPNASQLAVFSVHQSGINSFQLEKIGLGEFILTTGGDDNLICASCIRIAGGKVEMRQVWESQTAHSCQITGIKILRSFLITTSIDQRITVWQWSWRKGEFKVEYLNQYLTAVPDIKGMDATWLNDFTILIAVHGKGTEILKVNVKSIKSEL